tara:strand:+ start:1310 stop:2212 length:903 start_codon:yes stop_codon:yes gene_type:complete
MARDPRAKFHIIYTYYENIELLKEVVDYYTNIKADKIFDFTIIDDASPNNPATRDVVPEHWNLFTHTEDRGWGNEMMRNAMMRINKHDWVGLLDLDYVIDLEDRETSIFMGKTFWEEWHRSIRHVPTMWQASFGKRTAYNELEGLWAHEKIVQELPKLIDAPINSFFISDFVWKNYTYGYDMAFGFAYGNDCTLPMQFKNEPNLPYVKLKKIRLQAVENHSIADDTIYQPWSERHKELMDKYGGRSYHPQPRLKGEMNQRWVWGTKRDQKMDHLNECIEWPIIKADPKNRLPYLKESFII